MVNSLYVHILSVTLLAAQTAIIEAQDPGWRIVTPLGASTTIAYNVNRTTHAGDTVETWTFFRYSVPQVMAGQRVKEIRQHVRIGCTSLKWQVLGGQTIDAKGTTLASDWTRDSQPTWTEAPPDSRAEAMIDGVCLAEASWTAVSHDGDRSVFYSPDHITTRGVLREAWMRIDLAHPKSLSELGMTTVLSKTYTKLIDRLRVDCTTQRLTHLEHTLFRADGGILGTVPTPPSPDENTWQHLSPNTIESSIAISVCNSPSW